MQTQKVIQIDNNVQSSVPCALTVLSDPDRIFNIGQKKKDDLEMSTTSPPFVPLWSLILMLILNIF